MGRLLVLLVVGVLLGVVTILATLDPTLGFVAGVEIYLYPFAIGLVFVVGGLLAILDPKLGLARDVELVTSDERGPAERLASIVGGLLLLVVGLFFGLLGVSV